MVSFHQGGIFQAPPEDHQSGDLSSLRRSCWLSRVAAHLPSRRSPGLCLQRFDSRDARLDTVLEADIVLVPVNGRRALPLTGGYRVIESVLPFFRNCGEYLSNLVPTVHLAALRWFVFAQRLGVSFISLAFMNRVGPATVFRVADLGFKHLAVLRFLVSYR